MRSNLGLNSILGTAFPSPGVVNNASDPSSAPMAGISPSSLLEAFIPGYGPIQKFLLYSFGFDVTVLVSLGAVIWLGLRIGRSVWAVIAAFVTNNYVAEVTVHSNDEIHLHLIAFLAQQHNVSSHRRLMAETPARSAWEVDDANTEPTETTVDASGNIRWLNFSNQEAKSQPRFTPAIGSHNFWHQGRYFQLRRKQESMFNELGNGAASFKDKEVLTLSCFGRSSAPIKRLIQHAKNEYLQGHHAKTVIKRPAPKDMRRFGGRGSWVKVAERPCRPMNTVVLDEERKMAAMKDINDYLNPSTARWYANRGIPYRRGYLFYGPPGTGKSSLTFALAGVFGLDIHVVSLLEPTLTEEELSMLFTNLPARCIVLLEDIDTAGLVRNAQNDVGQAGKPSTAGGGQDTELNVATLTKALKKANDLSDEEKKKGISLSGLLNIIDGVASHEGRVLIMTTNHPEQLDEALIRPSRVDHQVAFSNATQAQIKELFERMYSDDTPVPKIEVSNTPAGKKNGLLSPVLEEESGANGYAVANGVANGTANPNRPVQNGAAHKPASPPAEKPPSKLSVSELSTIAVNFAAQVPDDVFSPAEIQGFLLRRKTEPQRAVEEVAAWVEGMVEQKRKGTKIVNVQ